MAKGIRNNWSAVVVVVVVGGAIAVIPANDDPNTDGTMAQGAQSNRCLASTAQPDPKNPDLDCPAPPNTFDVSSFFASNADTTAQKRAGPTWDAWAWASFAAMNWPAKVDPSQPTGYQRGVPSSSRSFADARSTDVVVWETFKEKRELFNPLVTDTTRWQDITFDPDQQPQTPANPGGIAMCQGADSSLLAEWDTHRLFSAGAKLSPSISGDNTLDETVEVASPAQEAASVLCGGYDTTTTPTYSTCVDSIFPDGFVTDSTNRRTPVGPRVWKGDPGTDSLARPVFFEVKVNYDYWKYIVQNGFNDDSVAYDAARDSLRSNHPKLPFRTSASTGPGRSPNAKFDYDANQVAATYDTLPNPDSLPEVGSVQIKAAWLLLDSTDVASQYHTTIGVYYETIAGAPPDSVAQDPLKYTCFMPGQFGLIGLHIIQRVHSAVFSRENPELFAHGGTFIFATWEHIGLGAYNDSSAYYYANFLAKNTLLNTTDSVPFDIERTAFPNVTTGHSAINVVRMKDFPLPTTDSVNAAVHNTLDDSSVWQNYRLIGTQFVAVNDSSTSAMYNQPYYLANLVIETNQGLQNFRGLPPGVSTTPYYTQKVTIDSTTTSPAMFQPTYPNVIFNREQNLPVNMGGCMGCHGIAQLNGYNFSFVFLAGQRGAGLDTQRHFDVASGAISPSNR